MAGCGEEIIWSGLAKTTTDGTRNSIHQGAFCELLSCLILYGTQMMLKTSTWPLAEKRACPFYKIGCRIAGGVFQGTVFWYKHVTKPLACLCFGGQHSTAMESSPQGTRSQEQLQLLLMRGWFHLGARSPSLHILCLHRHLLILFFPFLFWLSLVLHCSRLATVDRLMHGPINHSTKLLPMCWRPGLDLDCVLGKTGIVSG